MAADQTDSASEWFTGPIRNDSRVSVQCYGLVSQSYNVAFPCKDATRLRLLVSQTKRLLSDSTIPLLV